MEITGKERGPQAGEMVMDDLATFSVYESSLGHLLSLELLGQTIVISAHVPYNSRC